MATKTYEFDVAMTCEGCSGAVERVLKKKQGIENIAIDLPGKKVCVTSELPPEEILECIKKTGKAASFIGVQE
ncbi:copper transport protein ATOX1 [Venturia canescens]|uniref:copper transport protein ATOX1 n=1 Tax=Venturia canescens TaxID=32260 RepID=UPI001C9C4E8B|nr:copper transport protein ATOX1 [Venturia canescens]